VISEFHLIHLTRRKNFLSIFFLLLTNQRRLRKKNDSRDYKISSNHLRKSLSHAISSNLNLLRLNLVSEYRNENENENEKMKEDENENENENEKLKKNRELKRDESENENENEF
jgi:phage repressor protein C with HTH and peptisase S24 domain